MDQFANLYRIDESDENLVWAYSEEEAINHYKGEVIGEVIVKKVDLIDRNTPLFVFVDKYGELRWWFKYWPEEGDELKEETTVGKFFDKYCEGCTPMMLGSF